MCARARRRISATFDTKIACLVMVRFLSRNEETTAARRTGAWRGNPAPVRRASSSRSSREGAHTDALSAFVAENQLRTTAVDRLDVDGDDDATGGDAALELRGFRLRNAEPDERADEA